MVDEIVAPFEPTHDGKPKTAPAHLGPRVARGFTRRHLAEQFAGLGFTNGAEIGVADGRYSELLLQTIPGLRLLCVDPWKPYKGNTRGGSQAQHDGNLDAAMARFRPYVGRVSLAVMVSLEAVRNVAEASLDFVYIDGNHAFDYVLQDLVAWSSRVRPGGIVAGHDCYDFRGDAGVVAAVEAYTKAHGIKNWQLCDEREPSFWWVKP